MDTRRKLLDDFADAQEYIKKRQEAFDKNKIDFRKALTSNNLLLAFQFAKQEQDLSRVDYLKEVIDKAIQRGRFDIADKAAEELRAYVPAEMLIGPFENFCQAKDFDKILDVLKLLSEADRVVLIQKEIMKATTPEEDKNYLASIFEALFNEKTQNQQQGNKRRKK